jgi:hypothetical protein
MSTRRVPTRLGALSLDCSPCCDAGTQVIISLLDDDGTETTRYYTTLNAIDMGQPLYLKQTIFPALPPGNYHVYSPGQAPPDGRHLTITVFAGVLVQALV